MSIEENKVIARKFVECLSRGDIEGLVSTIGEDVIFETMGSSIMSRRRSRAELPLAYRTILAACPDGVRLTIRSITAEDDRVSVEAQGSAMAVSGKSYNNQYHFLFLIRDGKVRELREYVDTKLLDEIFGPLLKSDPTLSA